MTVTITLTTAGYSTGPFNLYSDATLYSTPFETGVSKASLVAGYTSSAVPDGTTIVRVQSVGTCNTQVDLTIASEPTTTTTSTSTTLPGTFNVTIYGKKSGTGGGTVYGWYSFDGSTYIQLATAMSTTCSMLGIITGVTSGQTIYLLGETAAEAVTYATAGTVGSVCPGVPGSCGAYSYTVAPGTADQFSITVNVSLLCG